MIEHPGFGEATTGVEHPADGSLSPPAWGDFRWELCNGTLVVESYVREGSAEHRVRLADRLAGVGLSLRWEQWEDLKEAISESPAEAMVRR